MFMRPRRGSRRRPAPPAAAAPPRHAVGIDLGTTNTVVAVLRAGDAAPSVLRADGGGLVGASGGAAAFTIPSIAAVAAGGAWLVGGAARAQAPANPLATYYSAKRLIGRRHADVAATPLVYRTRAGPDGGVRLECPHLASDLSPQQVSAEVLRHAVALAARHLDADVDEAVVTIPAYFSEQQRAATAEAAQLAGLRRVSLLQEPVAAAVAFGFGKPYEAETVLVFDLGGGTYDVSVLDSFEGIMEVLATAGDGELGGDDYDRALAALLLRRLAASAGAAAAAAAAADPSAAGALLRAAEGAKIRLSSGGAAEVKLPGFVHLGGGGGGGVVGLDTVVTADDLLAATAALRRRLWPPLATAASECKLALAGDGDAFEAALAARRGAGGGAAAGPGSGAAAAGGGQAGGGGGTGAAADKYAPKPRSPTAAVLVGGATRMPVVRDYVRHVTGLEPRAEVDPEQCVALGAAIQAGILLGLTSGVEIMDGSYVEELHARASGFQKRYLSSVLQARGPVGLNWTDSAVGRFEALRQLQSGRYIYSIADMAVEDALVVARAR
ncbi:MAG: Hsp70 protein-domain-containing protein [Monoraphidium minutum]|nr:MAG: Hsp70 protein-domain-containing protein [Monoraphidium minutum]